MNTNTGGPAFPTKRRVQRAGYLTDEYEPCGGMTLRDYFAAKAMTIHMATLSSWDAGSQEAWLKEISRLSYITADAMLKAREAA